MSNLFYNLGAKYGFGWHENHAKQVINLCMQLYDQIVALGMFPRASDIDAQVIESAGFVHDIGRSSKAIGAGEHNERSVVTLRKELGTVSCAKEDIQLMLYCVHHHTGDLWKKAPAGNEVPLNLIDRAKRLCAVFRVADALDHGLQRRVDRVSLTLDGKKLTCQIFPTSGEEDGVLRVTRKDRQKRSATS